MIRDPSDGSVKEKPKSAPVRKTPHNSGERLPSSDAASAGADTFSGLPPLTRNADELSRLEESRKWLKNYALVAQRIEQGSSRPEVAGSIPSECSPNVLEGK